MTTKTHHPYPLQCYVLRAIQDICEVENKKTFTNNELYPEITSRWPNIEIAQIQTSVSKVMIHGGYVKFLHRRHTIKGEKGVYAVYEITSKGAQTDWKTIPGYEQIIKSPEYKKPIRPEKAKSPSKIDERIKTSELPAPDAVIPSDLLGESVIMFIEKLKSKTRELGEMISSLQSELKKEKEAFKLIKNNKEAKEDELKKVISNLQNRIRTVDRSKAGISMGEIVRFR